MSDDFKAQLVASLGWKWTSGTVIDDGQLRHAQEFTAAGSQARAEAVWHDQEAILLEGTSRELDLTALERTVFDDLLRTVLVDVRGILAINHSGAGRLIVGGAEEDVWSAPFGDPSHTVEVPAHGALLLACREDGWPVDGRHCNLRLAAQGDDVTYSIAVLGTLTQSSSESSGSGST